MGVEGVYITRTCFRDEVSNRRRYYCRIVAHSLSHSLKDIHLLDAGCGSGTYARSLLEMGVGKITLLDASREMLDIAEEKLADAIKTKEIDTVVHSKLPELPFEEETFDAVMYNQTLHHLDTLGDGSNFPLLEKTLDTLRKFAHAIYSDF